MKFPFHSVAEMAPFRNMESPNNYKSKRLKALFDGRALVSALIFLFSAVMTGCDHLNLGIPDNLDECVTGVQLLYDYNEENTTSENKIEYWVHSIDEYIFDQSHILCSVRRLAPGEFASLLELPEGKYSVIAIGNMDGRSRVGDGDAGTTPKVGKTRRENLNLSLQNAEQFPDGTRGPCEELFHCYRTFSVAGKGISRIRADMVNAHFQLRFKVRWQNTDLPQAGAYYAVVEDAPSQYSLMPEWVYPSGRFEAQRHNPAGHDAHPTTSNETIHHLPETAIGNTLDHSNITYLNSDFEVWGEIVRYRVKSSTPMTLNLYYAPDGTRAVTDIPVLPRSVDLRECLEYFEYNLDHTLKQEYTLDIEINGKQIIINPIDGLSIADWTDGGHL